MLYAEGTTIFEALFAENYSSFSAFSTYRQLAPGQKIKKRYTHGVQSFLEVEAGGVMRVKSDVD